MTGCASCGSKGLRVCDQCQRRNVVAEVVGLLLTPEPAFPTMLGQIQCKPPRHEDAIRLDNEPEPVELTVDDVLAFAQGLLDDREHPFNDRKVELERRTHGWTLYSDRDGSRWPADGPAELRDVVIYAKKGGLL